MKIECRGGRIELTGQKFNRLTVIEQGAHIGSKIRWVCLCDCGNYILVTTDKLRSGRQKSCGCYRRENITKIKTKHGLVQHPLYWILASMIQRCENPNNKDYHLYGARGITICDEWRKDIPAFIKWGEESGWLPGLTIERLDVNQGYSPKNCTWITMGEQSRNTRRNIFVEINGNKFCLSEAIRKMNTNTKESTIRRRMTHGKSFVEAIR